MYAPNNKVIIIITFCKSARLNLIPSAFGRKWAPNESNKASLKKNKWIIINEYFYFLNVIFTKHSTAFNRLNTKQYTHKYTSNGTQTINNLQAMFLFCVIHSIFLVIGLSAISDRWSGVHWLIHLLKSMFRWL